MPPKYSRPIICVPVTISHDILSSNRVPGQITIYENEINILFHPPDQSSKIGFTLTDFSIQVLPNLDTLFVISSERNNKSDVYIFLSNDRARDNVISTMRLLNFTLIDEFRRRIISKKMRCNSLPSLSTIIEESRQ